MKSFDEFYWKHNDYLNKDTSLAHSFGEKVWLHKQQKIDELQKRIDDALNVMCKLQYSSGERIYDEVGKILKGDNHES